MPSDRQAIGPCLVRIADEFGGQLGQRGIHGELRTLAAARSLALLGHGALEALTVDADPAFRRDLHGQVDREAERVVQPERLAPGDQPVAAGRLDQRQQLLAARLQRARELASSVSTSARIRSRASARYG